AAEREEFAARIRAEPRRYIAQRRVELSTCPTWDKASESVVPRRVDLRPYLLFGKSGPWVLPGGLTRVALVEGSYVVNSSQGGGSKDTWVLSA
ncbi:MAG: circularly permuted type 2 ATP-grasp protein, partial [Deltaproteobacteria bacterium]